MSITIPKPKNIRQKTVLMRVDYNVPLKKQGSKLVVADDRRIQNSLRTLKFLLDNQAKVIIISHLGRPKDVYDQQYSLEPVACYLRKNLHLPVNFIHDCIGETVETAVEELQPSQALLLENLRFYPEEKKNDPAFAKKLANLAEIYINEAFSNSHRDHASMTSTAKLLPHYAGMSLKNEVDNLGKLLEKPKHPFVIIIGGAKISDKVEAVKHLSKIADIVLVGGGVANNFLKAEGIEIHKSYLQDTPADLKKQGINYVKFADQLIETNKTEKLLMDGYIPLPKILYPIDVIAAKSPDNSTTETINLTHDCQDTSHDQNLMYLDIGPKTIKLFQEIILEAATVFWNGPMGMFEKKLFSRGTEEVARAIAKSSATTILGGGDTLRAINQYKLEDRFDYVSAAGGAALDFLAGKKLPGLEMLKE